MCEHQCGLGHSDNKEPVPYRDEKGVLKVNLSRRDIVRGLATGSVVAIAAGCTYNEELGRNQLLIVSSDQMAQLAQGAWLDLRKKQPTTNDPRYVNVVREVSAKVVAAAGSNPAAWDVQVFQSKQLNAFALPGGRIGVYTGIMDTMENKDQLATVLGHEVAHVKYNHSGERYSQSSLAAVGLTVAQVATRKNEYNREIMQVLGLGVTLGYVLPFSRRHELEADKFGLRFMAKAGYDPRQSIRFWQRMAAGDRSKKPPELLSTHPSDATRIAELKRELARMGYATS